MTKEEAIKRIKDWSLDDDDMEVLSTLIPELKESRDEKIRKAIKLLVEMKVEDSIGLEPVYGASYKEMIAWLEKQGEQKHTDKVVPKFKVGDWIITDKNHIWFVDEDCSTAGYLYRLISQNGKVEVADYNIVDEHARLWTIQDAKDGDVLNSTRVQATIIFKGFNHDCKHIDAYCALQSGIFIHQEMLWDRDFEPAHEVWKNKLFKAMKEAGYEWDAEKKRVEED